MAQQDSLGKADSTAKYTVRYTSFQPQQLPDSARRSVLHAELHTMAEGVYFARTRQYPAGAYWVMLALN
ncbi:MAG: hypothetical protein H0X25_02170 [Acidobacteriales bacterium]|nr:hypothetical protein [Terriglobales bacterium]